MFHSAHSALAWAYETINRPIVKMSSVNHMREQNTRRMPNEAIMDLSVHEQHAQAAAIIGMAERLNDAAGREYVAARFGDMTRPEDVTIMMHRIFSALGTGAHDKRGVYEFLRCYFGGERGYKEIARQMKCRNTTALEIRNKVYDTLDWIGTRAMAEMSDTLAKHRLIESAQMYA